MNEWLNQLEVKNQTHIKTTKAETRSEERQLNESMERGGDKNN